MINENTHCIRLNIYRIREYDLRKERYFVKGAEFYYEIVYVIKMMQCPLNCNYRLRRKQIAYRLLRHGNNILRTVEIGCTKTV